jgi:hypothetical protein
LAQFTYQNGNETAVGTIELPIPSRSDFESVYCFAFPKSGSVLVNDIARSLVADSNICAFDFPAELYNKGIDSASVVCDFDELFPRTGFFFGGFREKPRWMLGANAVLQAKKILVVRDPRDMLVSLYYSVKFSHGFQRRGTPQFNTLIGKMISDSSADIDDYCLKYSFFLNMILFNMSDILDNENTIVIRYEDFVYNKVVLVDNICRWLSLNVSSKRIGEILVPHEVFPTTDKPLDHIRQVHPGDHVRKLKSKTISALNSVLGEFLERYNY